MISVEAFFSAFLAGMIYVLVPGPATLATLSLNATRGRFVAFQFLAAHLVGDVLWSLLALLALVGVSRLGPGLFDVLGLVCGLYLLWLGGKALFGSRREAAPLVADPVRGGLVFGLSNPKAYPFALAMLTAIIGTQGGEITLAAAAMLLGGCLAGFVLADLIVLFWTGLSQVRRVFMAHGAVITRATGLLFIAFGGKAIADSAAAIRAR